MKEQPQTFQFERAQVRVSLKRLNPCAWDDMIVTIIPSEGAERTYHGCRDLFDDNLKVAKRAYAEWIKENNL